MTPHFLKWSFGPKIESVDGICQQTDSRNRFYLDVKTGPNGTRRIKQAKLRTPPYVFTNSPNAKSTRNLAGMSRIMLGASANNMPPKLYIPMLTAIAARRPFLFDTVPASMTPNGSPIANTEKQLSPTPLWFALETPHFRWRSCIEARGSR